MSLNHRKKLFIGALVISVAAMGLAVAVNRVLRWHKMVTDNAATIAQYTELAKVVLSGKARKMASRGDGFAGVRRGIRD